MTAQIRNFASKSAAPIRVLALVSLLFIYSCGQASGGVREVSVSENRILLDDSESLIEGYIFQNFLYSIEDLTACRTVDEFCEKLVDARDFYFGRGKFDGRSGLDVAEDFGANTIRLNLNQVNLDTNSLEFSEHYVSEVSEAVEFARSKGFVVILALFDGRNENVPEILRDKNPVTPLNNDVSLGAARLLAKNFGDDNGVMLELLNETYSPGSRDVGWKLWRDGGTAKRGRFAGRTFVGVNEIIAAIRAEQARNIIIVQGLGASFRDYPGGLIDPLNRIAYSVHPFFGDGEDDRMDWDGNFGDFAESHPFVITAWNSPARKGWCEKLGVNKPQEFLDYLKTRQIGLVVFALDVGHTVLKDFRKNTSITTRYSKNCKRGEAAGEITRRYFLNN